MSIKKLPDPPGTLPGGYPCLHPEHNPPNMIVLPPGRYEHTCPGCGKKAQFTVTAITC